jgi:sporulation protein YlmC with PRC-barrel domain
MKKTRKTILSASAITAFSLTLALGLSANVDQTSQQQGAPLQGVHPPTQYGTPGERANQHHQSRLNVEQQDRPAQRSQAQMEERREYRTEQQETRMEQQPMLGQQHSQQDAVAQLGDGQSHKATDLLNKRLENHEGERLGSIEDLIIDVESGELEYVVVSAGGVLGIGGDLRAVPPAALSVSGEDRVVLNISSDRWEQAPTFERDQVAQLEQQSQEIESFYQQDQQFGATERSEIRTEREFGARDQQPQQQSDLQARDSDLEWQNRQQDQQTTEWGTTQRETETRRELRNDQRDTSPRAPAQNWQQRHQSADPHRLPGDPYGSPAEPSVLPPDRTEVQRDSHLRESTQMQQQEFGAREYETQAQELADDSRATEWRARAFEDDLRQAGASRESQERQTVFGARDHRDDRRMTTRTTERVELDSREKPGAPALNNPRLHFSHRGTERPSQDFVFGATQRQRVEEQRTYGQPDYRQEARQELNTEYDASQFGAPQREQQWEQRETQQWEQRETRQPAQMQEQQTMRQQDTMTQRDQTAMRGESNLKMASDLIGRNVSDQQQEEIGEISDFIVDLQSGRIEHTIVEATGQESGHYAVPLRQLQIDGQGDRVTLQSSRQQLQQAPRYDQRAARQQGGQQIYRYEEQRTETRREFGAPLREDEEPASQDEEVTQQQETTEFGAREAEPETTETTTRETETRTSPDGETTETQEEETEVETRD